MALVQRLCGVEKGTALVWMFVRARAQQGEARPDNKFVSHRLEIASRGWGLHTGVEEPWTEFLVQINDI